MPERRGHAGHDLKRDAGIGQRFGFFAAAAEDEGVAAFEADYGEAAARAVDEHAADFVLGEFVGGFLFADVDAFGVGRGEIEEGRVGEVIVENGVGLLEDAAAFEGDELRVAGAGSDEVDLHGHGIRSLAVWGKPGTDSEFPAQLAPEIRCQSPVCTARS